jgi:hypothetical protein
MLSMEMHIAGVARATRHRIAERRIYQCCGDPEIALAVVMREQQIEIELELVEFDATGTSTLRTVRMPLPLAKLLTSALDETITNVGELDELDESHRTKRPLVCAVVGDAVGGSVVVMADRDDIGVSITATVTTLDSGAFTFPLPDADDATNLRDALLDLVMVANCLQESLREAKDRTADEPEVDVIRNPEQVTLEEVVYRHKWPASSEVVA